jgi:adenylate cyclase
MRYVQHRSFDIRPPPANPQRRTYLGITGVLLVIVLALAGGIIWYNTKKSNQLVVAAADRMIEEVGEHVSDRLKLIYDPMYVIIGTASLMPELTSPSIVEDPRALSLIRRVLSVYPQILSLYVGFDSGDFFMVTHVAGENSKELRAALKAPQETAFASETISANAGGERKVRWVFLREEGSVVGSSDPVPSEFDPRQRPWYDTAKDSEAVEPSELYVFASSGEPGFTLSRGSKGNRRGWSAPILQRSTSPVSCAISASHQTAPRSFLPRLAR